MTGAERRRADKEAGEAAVLARRARIAALVRAGTRVGYGLFLAAVVLFGIGFAAGFTGAITAAIVGALVAGSLVLAPSIVFGYAVRAAEREDRQAGLAHGSSADQDRP